MDYEQKYKDALERAKEIHNEHKAQCADIMIKIFPELKESEDERIRKELIKYFTKGKEYLSLIPYSKDECIAWLEKQGEHAKFRESIQVGDQVTRNQDGMLVNLSQLKRVAKPSEQGELKPAWSEEDEEMLTEIISDVKFAQDKSPDTQVNQIVFEEEINWLKSLKDRAQPRPAEWSEEDERLRRKLIELIYAVSYCDERENLSNWLKSLRPQSHWKPSEEQMEALKNENKDENSRD